MRRKKDGIRLTREERAFMSELYKQHAHVAYYAALRQANDPQVALDLTQECFLCLMKHISTLQDMECCKINAYIVVAIRRIYLNYALRESKRQHLSLSGPSAVAEARKTILEKQEMQEEVQMTLSSVLGQLSPHDRRILESYYIVGLTDAEVAAELGCKPESIRAMRSRACERARLAMEKGEDTNG